MRDYDKPGPHTAPIRVPISFHEDTRKDDDVVSRINSVSQMMSDYGHVVEKAAKHLANLEAFKRRALIWLMCLASYATVTTGILAYLLLWRN